MSQLEDTFKTFIEPQLNLIRGDIKDFVITNATEHREVIASLDKIMNGNGIIGHRQLAREWTSFKKRKASKVELYIKVGLIGLNIIMALVVGKLFNDFTKIDVQKDKPVSTQKSN